MLIIVEIGEFCHWKVHQNVWPYQTKPLCVYLYAVLTAWVMKTEDFWVILLLTCFELTEDEPVNSIDVSVWVLVLLCTIFDLVLIFIAHFLI